MHGCWSQEKNTAMKIPEDIIGRIGVIYGSYDANPTGWMWEIPVHSSNQGSGPRDFQQGPQAEAVDEPPFNRYQISRAVFAHITRLDPNTAKPPFDPNYLINVDRFVQGRGGIQKLTQ